MEWVLILAILVFVIHRYAKKKTGKKQGVKGIQLIEIEESPGILAYTVPSNISERKVVEFINKDGVPEFKFRFNANLEFDTVSDVLRRHRAEIFFPRPNGYRGPIAEPGGIGRSISEWDDPERAWRYEDEQFKYIGGVKVYIALLLKVREIYEDATRTPKQKKEEIEKICLANNDVYTVRHIFSPPWEALLVPALSLGEGIGPHRVKILEKAGVKSIHHVRSRTDAELLDIKGIGKVAVAALRNLSSRWLWDEKTEVIEKDEEYRKTCSSITN